MRIFTIIVAALFLCPAIAGAIEENLGDFVKLVERDFGIPVHPDAGDSYVRMFDPDILAAQEVDGEKALKRVVDTDVYNVHVSSRSKPSGMNGKQNTGFAYKKGPTVQEMPDVKTLDVAGDESLRYGTLIRVTHNGRSFKMLSVHLKSGCFSMIA